LADFCVDYDFLTASEYTFDDSVVDIPGADVSGEARLKDNLPSDTLSYATFDNTIDLTYGGGTLTGTATGGAAVVSNRLDLAGFGKYVTYEGVNNVNFGSIGAIKFEFTPDYSGVPVPNRNTFFSISLSPTQNENEILLEHRETGDINLSIRDENGTAIVSNVTLDNVSLTLGQKYEFELNVDLVSGATRLFLSAGPEPV
jgi:hypothetical protein